MQWNSTNCLGFALTAGTWTSGSTPHSTTPLVIPASLLTLSKGQYFSTLDCKSGYCKVVLNEEISPLTTYNTPYGC